MVAALFAPLLASLPGLISDVVDRTLPASAEREKMKLEFQTEMVKAMSAIDTAQIEVNKEEAKHASLFVAGWRPFIGWTCGLALCYHKVGLPLLQFAGELAGETVIPPAFDMDALYPVLLGMLGLGGLRTVEKVKGVTLSLPGKPTLPWRDQ